MMKDFAFMSIKIEFYKRKEPNEPVNLEGEKALLSIRSLHTCSNSHVRSK